MVISTLCNAIRKECIEYFEASPFDVIVTRNGRHTPITVGRVGIRYKFCGKSKPSERATEYAHFPSSVEKSQLQHCREFIL